MPFRASPMRLIAHLDMDAFYASVELLRYPELRGRPVVIGGGRRHAPVEAPDPASGKVSRRFHTLAGYSGRGVITTATYEARALGLHSAQSLGKAAALAPEAVLLPVDFEAYRAASRAFKTAVRALVPTVEDRGIDEIYLDLTETVRQRILQHGAESAGTSRADAEGEEPSEAAWEAAQQLARELKQAVRTATGLSCSIAVAPNKLLAKIASDLDKPDGLTMLRRGDVPVRIWPLPVRKVNGIGPKTDARLAALGLRTIGELAVADPAALVARFGHNLGTWLHEAANGRDERCIVTSSEPRSISREVTFERDLHAREDRETLSRIFTGLCAGVAADLVRKGYVARTIGLKLRYDNFRTVTRAQTVGEPTDDAQVIRRVAGECLKRVSLSRRMRLLGVRAGTLSRKHASAGPAALSAAEPTLPLF